MGPRGPSQYALAQLQWSLIRHDAQLMLNIESTGQVSNVATAVEAAQNESILESLRPLTGAVLENDPKLRFARIVCMRWKENFPLTVMQITTSARMQYHRRSPFC